ncbi:MAG: hypothetical protein QXP36_05555 [Conexivisphaerales archaeon]
MEVVGLLKSCAWLENGKCKFYSGNHTCGVSHWKSCKAYLNRKRLEESGEDKPLCDCVHWGENVFPYFDDGCHLGYSYCNPKTCDDYQPVKRR